MRFVIVTGMSGAGKSTALKMLEDMGYFCVDNLPVPLLPKFAEMIAMPDSKLNQAAVGIDIRGGQVFRGLEGYLKELDESGIHYEILFLDAGNDVLLCLQVIRLIQCIRKVVEHLRHSLQREARTVVEMI